MTHPSDFFLYPETRENTLSSLSQPSSHSADYVAAERILITSANHHVRLDRWLRRQRPLEPFSLLQKWIRTGQIRLDGKRIKGSALLQAGQEVRLPPYFKSEASMLVPTKPRSDPKWLAALQEAILYEDDHLLVFNKPAGLAVQGGSKTLVSLDNLVKDLPIKGSHELRLTHRLDKDTSGVLVMAKSAQDAAWITALFKDNRMEKEYWALVVGRLPKKIGIIDLPLLKGAEQDKEKMCVDTERGLPARTRYAVQDNRNDISWVIFYPETGRTHQVRLHSAASGCPVLGDGKYGAQKAHPLGKRSRLHLHAHRLTLIYPSGVQKTFTAPLSPHFHETFRDLGFEKKRQ